MDVFLTFISDPKTGALGILGLWCWFLKNDRDQERDERRKLQEGYNELQERTIVGLNNAALAVTSTSATIDSLKTSIATITEALRRDR